MRSMHVGKRKCVTHKRDAQRGDRRASDERYADLVRPPSDTQTARESRGPPAPDATATNLQDFKNRKTDQLPKTTGVRSGQQSLEEMSGNHDALDFAGPFPDLADLGVAHVALDGVVLGVTVTAVDLDGLDGRPHGQF